MRRITILAVAAVAVATAVFAVLASAEDGKDNAAVADSPSSYLRDSGPDLPAATFRSRPPGRRARLIEAVANARLATARYATDLERAKADGYRIITPMIPDMGFHYMNPAIKEFDVRRPMILVYEKRGDEYQLGALEWVFPKKPSKPPLPGAKYGAFAAACHYEDGTFVPEGSEQRCQKTNPETGSPFSFWHPKLVTLHFWVWYPNPDGLFAGMNPFVRPFNEG